MSIKNIRNKLLNHQSISYNELSVLKYGRKDKISGIYKIENLVNHKVYIGQSVNIIKRLKGHVKDEGNPHLKCAFEKYGNDNFSFEILKTTYDRDYWEIFLIQLYKATDERYGYNISIGGDGGNLGEAVNKKISETIRKLHNSPRGEIVRQKIREKRMLQAPRTKEQEEKRLKNLAKFWNSPEGLAKKKELSERSKAMEHPKLTWYTNGVINTRAKECPEGFWYGRSGVKPCSEETKQKKREIEKNLTPEQRAERSRKISVANTGKHFTEEQKKHIGDGNRGRKYFNNGEIEVMQFECPPGFVPGRCPKSKASISKGMRNPQN